MAKNDKSPNAGYKNRFSRKRLDLQPVAFIDNMVFSEKECWAYYRVENRGYDFISPDAQSELIRRLTNSFNNLVSDRNITMDGHLIVTSAPVDIDLWEKQMYDMSAAWNRSPGFEDYIRMMGDFLRNENYASKVVYLGFMLGKRGALNVDNLNPFENGLDGVKELGAKWLRTSLKLPTAEVPEDEENEYRAKEEDIHRTLSIGSLKAKRCTAEELLLQIKRQFYPAMPAPYLTVDHDNRFGVGDLVLETDSVIKNKFRWLEFDQMVSNPYAKEEIVQAHGYRATLSMTKFPKEMVFPGSMPFLYYIYKLGLPFSAYARFTIRNTKEMKKELEKKKKEQKDELENMAQGLNNTDLAVGGMPEEASEALYDQQRMSAILASDKTAWVEGSYFIVIEAPTLEILKKYVAAVKDRYADNDITINWTSGDQALLFLSQMPGDFHRMQSFDQVTTLGQLPGSGFNLSSEVGDEIASPLGSEGLRK